MQINPRCGRNVSVIVAPRSAQVMVVHGVADAWIRALARVGLVSERARSLLDLLDEGGGHGDRWSA